MDAALAVANLGRHPGVSAPDKLGARRLMLAQCNYFRTEAVTLTGESSFSGGPGAVLVAFLEGDGEIDHESFGPGQVWVIPPRAEMFSIRPHNGARWLRVVVP